MEYTTILYEQIGAIVKITLNRPKVLNALNADMVIELKHAIERIAQDDSVKVMIVTGAGRAFSAGVDLKAMNQQSGIKGGLFEGNSIISLGNEMIETMQTMPKVTIAMVNGYTFTGAMELMMTFDLILAADEAKIGDTHAKWGIMPKWGMTQRLPLLVGILKARELSFTARAVTGKEAERLGLVNRSVPLAELESATMQMAGAILQNSAQAIAAIKLLYHKGIHTTLKEGLQIEQDTNTEITDRKEFLKNFEKNKKK